MPEYEIDENGCWLWTGAIDRDGYGHVGGAHERRAHREAYWQAFGPIPIGFDVHHKCEIKCCVNPDHLEALSRVDHLRWHWSEWADTTDEIREFIREIARNPRITARQLSESFGIPRSTVNKIIQGYSWFDGEPVEVERPHCLSCDEPIEGGRRHKKFCTKTCRWTYNNRRRRLADA